MDKETYFALKAVLHPYFRAGGTLANAIEAVHAAQLDVEDEQKRAGAAESLPATENEGHPGSQIGG